MPTPFSIQVIVQKTKEDNSTSVADSTSTTLALNLGTKATNSQAPDAGVKHLGSVNHATKDSSDADEEPVSWLNVVEHDELAKCLNTCVERWRNAGPEARKKMYALFAIAGIFLVVCRHGHLLVICDMIRSGEL